MTAVPKALDETTPAFYRRTGADTFEPTIHAQGAWRDDEQHMGPVSGLVTHAIAGHEPREGMQLGRLAFDILGMIPAGPSRVTVRIARPGRTIELLEAVLTVGERPVVRAHAWRVAPHDSRHIAGLELEPMPGPDAFPEASMPTGWAGGYIRQLEVRAESYRPGRSRVWLRARHPLVLGEFCSATADYVRLVDTANGVAVRASPRAWLFPNLDLAVHLFREPVPGWVGLDTGVTIGDTGLGVTSATLHDVEGPVGRAEQLLTVRKIV